MSISNIDITNIIEEEIDATLRRFYKKICDQAGLNQEDYDINFLSFVKNSIKNIKNKCEECKECKEYEENEMSIDSDPSFLQKSFSIKLKIQ